MGSVVVHGAPQIDPLSRFLERPATLGPAGEGGCAAPIGVLAEIVEGETGEELWVRAAALSLDGALAVRMSATGDPADATGVGDRLAEQMLDEGAGQLTETPEAPTARETQATPAAQTAQPRAPHEQPVTDCERQDA